MIDRKVCDRKFPPRWRSSLAVFSYEPPEQTDEKTIVSYLKVACTITGFQPPLDAFGGGKLELDEVGLKNRRLDNYWNAPEVADILKWLIRQYYGCYGAILEVAIGPPTKRGEEIKDLSRIPYFADFEPKKRELYEQVTETGEVMSRTLENVNVHKGATTSESHENVDILGGISAQLAANFAAGGMGGGASTSGAVQGEAGTRDVSQQQYANLRTTDQAREARETFSHTTQLTQMYHQFTAYHLGTNRAVFFMLPRPHIVQSDKTFVNGPRLLEGIQEVFLVVVRPRQLKDFCVEAYLETAHIAGEPIYEYENSIGTLNLHIQQDAKGTNTEAEPDSHADDRYIYREDSATFTPPDGWEVDMSVKSPYSRDSFFVSPDIPPDRKQKPPDATIVSYGPGHVTAKGWVTAWFEDRSEDDGGSVHHHGELDAKWSIHIRRKKPNSGGRPKQLWLTGRGVCCCALPHHHEEHTHGREAVVWEAPLETSIRMDLGRAVPISIQDANQLRAEIGHNVLRGMNDPGRYPRGEVTFMETKFLAQGVGDRLRGLEHPDNTPVAEIRGLPEAIQRKIVRVMPKATRAKLLRMSPAEQADRFGLNAEETSLLRRSLIGLEGPLPDPSHRWDRPQSIGKRSLPNLVGLSVQAAREMLRSIHVAVSEATYKDDERPKGTVLQQFPGAGTTVPTPSAVKLVLASGATVQIPDIVGAPLSQALCMLRDVGFEGEPEVIFAAAKGRNRNTVIQVSPAMRAYITPHARVVVRVSSGQMGKAPARNRRR